jgi:hypothetical protein
MSVTKTQVVAVSTPKERVAELKRQQRQIKSELYKLSLLRKETPSDKAEGQIYYAHSKFMESMPRISVAGHINEAKMELHCGAYICPKNRNWSRREARIRAMGKAISTSRTIIRLKSLDQKYVREQISTQLAKIELRAYTAAIAEANAKTAVLSIRARRLRLLADKYEHKAAHVDLRNHDMVSKVREEMGRITAACCPEVVTLSKAKLNGTH